MGNLAICDADNDLIVNELFAESANSSISITEFKNAPLYTNGRIKVSGSLTIKFTPVQ
jgi:hypothetical protein